MKILIVGADGMLGHQLTESWAPRHELSGTVRLSSEHYREVRARLPRDVAFSIDVRRFEDVQRVARECEPDAIVNAAGIVKQRADSKDTIASLEVNALFPHRLAELGRELGAKTVHLSTDCVFSGKKGQYSETDFADADDLYGRSKFLGEVAGDGAVTLRSSIIGLELTRKSSLIEWFLAQTGAIRGFRKAIYSGFTTVEMARIMEHVLMSGLGEGGVYQVASAPICKFDLLCLLKRALNRKDIEIMPDDDFHCDRSLVSPRFNADFKYSPPTWDAMIDELSVQIRERYKCY